MELIGVLLGVYLIVYIIYKISKSGSNENSYIPTKISKEDEDKNQERIDNIRQSNKRYDSYFDIKVDSNTSRDFGISVSYNEPIRAKNTKSVKAYKKLIGKKAVLNSFVVFDFETTGLSPHDSEIIEIGAIRVDNVKANNHQSFSSLVKPSQSISKRITKINGIDNAMVADAKSIAEVLQEFHVFIGDLPLIAHNASFDMKFLLHYLEEHGLKFMDNAVVDTLALARKAYPHLDNHKLPTLVDHLSINVNQLHRASDDSLAALYVYTTSVQLLYGAYKN